MGEKWFYDKNSVCFGKRHKLLNVNSKFDKLHGRLLNFQRFVFTFLNLKNDAKRNVRFSRMLMTLYRNEKIMIYGVE